MQIFIWIDFQIIRRTNACKNNQYSKISKFGMTQYHIFRRNT